MATTYQQFYDQLVAAGWPYAVIVSDEEFRTLTLSIQPVFRFNNDVQVVGRTIVVSDYLIKNAVDWTKR
jgi:hypothetical protein